LRKYRCGVGEVVGDVRQVFAGDVERARAVGAAGREDERLAAVSAGGRGEFELVAARAVPEPPDVGDRLVGVHLEVELLDDAAEVGEVLLAGRLAVVRVWSGTPAMAMRSFELKNRVCGAYHEIV
jgi:hypothetical protein